MGPQMARNIKSQAPISPLESESMLWSDPGECAGLDDVVTGGRCQEENGWALDGALMLSLCSLPKPTLPVERRVESAESGKLVLPAWY